MNKFKLFLTFGVLSCVIAAGGLTGCKSGKGGTESETVVIQGGSSSTATPPMLPGGNGNANANTNGLILSGESITNGISNDMMQTQLVEFLFVQTATNVSFMNSNMTLHGVNPLTVAFADRPERIAGHMPTTNIMGMWNEGKDSFLSNPPNATLSIMTPMGISNVVVVLRNPQMTGEDLTYEVELLEGQPPLEGGPSSLFIDIIGMPLTPYSYAGAARRAARRGYVYPGVYGPAVVPAYGYAPAVVAPVPGVVY